MARRSPRNPRIAPLAIAKHYFRALGHLVPDEFAFTKRTRRPPLDPFNTMLSFGYTLLMYDLYTAVSGCTRTLASFTP